MYRIEIKEIKKEEYIMRDTMKQSMHRKVLIGTTTPLLLKGILRSVMEGSDDIVTLGIEKPEAICDGYTCKLGEMLYIKNSDVASFGRFAEPQKREQKKHPITTNDGSKAVTKALAANEIEDEE